MANISQVIKKTQGPKHKPVTPRNKTDLEILDPSGNHNLRKYTDAQLNHKKTPIHKAWGVV